MAKLLNTNLNTAMWTFLHGRKRLTPETAAARGWRAGCQCKPHDRRVSALLLSLVRYRSHDPVAYIGVRQSTNYVFSDLWNDRAAFLPGRLDDALHPE